MRINNFLVCTIFFVMAIIVKPTLRAQSSIDLFNDIMPSNQTPVPDNDASDASCFDVEKIITDCDLIWVRVNVHFFLDDNCEGDIAAWDKLWCIQNNPPYLPGCDFSAGNVHNIAEMLINRSNEFAENMSDNSLFYNETMQLGIEPTTSSPPQCMPIRFLLDGVHIHCDTKSQLITDFNLFNSNQVNPTGAINIFITQTGTFPGGSNPGGFTNYGANAMVNASLTWGAPSTIIHEFAHMYWVRHPWEEGPVPYDLSDTFNPSWSWDHDCNPNTPEIESQTCWDTNPRHDGKNACGNPIFCTDHPCCDWDIQTSNIMAYSGWASNGDYATMSTQQLRILLTELNKDCKKVVAVDPDCPPASANIVIPPLEGTGSDCDFCINFGASMNETEYQISFEQMVNGIGIPFRSSGWVSRPAGQYCISLRSLKGYGDFLEGGFKKGGKYKITLNVKNDCGEVSTKTVEITLPNRTCVNDQDWPVLEVLPNPASDFTKIKISLNHSVTNALLVANHPLRGNYIVQNLGNLNAGNTEIDLNTYDWSEGFNFIQLVTDDQIYSTTLIKH